MASGATSDFRPPLSTSIASSAYITHSAVNEIIIFSCLKFTFNVRN